MPPAPRASFGEISPLSSVLAILLPPVFSFSREESRHRVHLFFKLPTSGKFFHSCSRSRDRLRKFNVLPERSRGIYHIGRFEILKYKTFLREFLKNKQLNKSFTDYDNVSAINLM